MLTYPDINPVALHLGTIKIYWYGVMYLLGFLSAWLLANWRIRHFPSPLTTQQTPDLIFFVALGVIIGGRMGYMLFYDFPNFMNNPWLLFKLWQGGMSFHGGLLGVLISLWLFGRRIGSNFFEMTDFFAPLVPIGLAAGRFGNFINGELVGRITHMPWGMVFPDIDNLPRHPSQLYEFALEGVLLFIIIWLYASKPRPKMSVSAVFLIGYGTLRIVAEFFRQPDSQWGFLAFNWLTMGQLLSIPMVLAGMLMLVIVYRGQFTHHKET